MFKVKKKEVRCFRIFVPEQPFTKQVFTYSLEASHQENGLFRAPWYHEQ
jgi:hypothetical protein